MATLGTRCSNQELIDGLKRSEEVVYTDNGNRAVKATTALRRIMPVLSAAGVSRLAEISQLTRGNFPVFQSSRPEILFHSSVGQNTGAQGKGRTLAQAKISCAMETLENVCMEPRNERLIRNTYAFLRRQHAVLPPWLFALQRGVAKPAATEPFVWTQALLLPNREPVLVPAEHVYFPFLPRDYGTRPTFTSTSNGVAAGSTYLEAAIHALYEVIERHYYGLWDTGKIRARAFMSSELDAVPHVRQFRHATQAEFEMEVPALRVPRMKNLPMCVCWLLRRDGTWLYGSGCASLFNTAILRAVSEATQAWAVLASGAREDLSQQATVTSLKNFPAMQTLTRKEYLKTTLNRQFDDLREEYRFLVSWLKSVGFPMIVIANLTRNGLNVPVVKAIVPGLLGDPNRNQGLRATMLDIHGQRFSYKRRGR
jgi:YcaO-like protein with predicted kinase domain